MIEATIEKSTGDVRRTVRRIVRSSGSHGPITRLVSPSDLGALLKPFVFLDRFAAPAAFVGAMPLHPHSGIATVTVLTEGNARYDDPEAGRGTIEYGGVEWMRAGNGVWHGQEMSAGTSTAVAGFQLWIALPPALENAVPDSQYVEAPDIPRIGPSRLVLGTYAGVQSPVRAPAGINYLLISLKAGERWYYDAPDDHDVAWLAVARGSLGGTLSAGAGDLVIFEQGPGSIEIEAAAGEGAVLVLGSAVAHSHDLVLGSHSVHTSAEALKRGEAQIASLAAELRQAGDRRRGGATPVYR